MELENSRGCQSLHTEETGRGGREEPTEEEREQGGAGQPGSPRQERRPVTSAGEPETPAPRGPA